MILVTYSKHFLSLLFSCLLVAAPCAAHKVHNHNIQNHQKPELETLSFKALTEHYTREYLLTGDDHILDDYEAQLSTKMNARSADESQIHYWLAQAWLAQARHEFDDAVKILQKVTEVMPQNGQAWLTKANVFNVQGKYSEAKNSCKMVFRHLSLQAGLLCKARLARSLDEKQRAFNTVETLLKQNINEEFEAWALSIAAELAASLDFPSKAEKYFLASLEKFPAVQVRVSYMDFLIEQKRYNDVVKLSHNSDNPALHVRELMAYQQLARVNQNKKTNQIKTIQQKIRKTHQKFIHWHEHGEHQHAREMAIFYLDVMQKPQLALSLAKINLQNQREPEDTALLFRAQQMIKINME